RRHGHVLVPRDRGVTRDVLVGDRVLVELPALHVDRDGQMRGRPLRERGPDGQMASSWRTWTKRIFSRRSRSASKQPLMPSPASPKYVSIPHSSRRSMISSELVGISAPWDRRVGPGYP